MDALYEIQATAGQEINEDIYGAVFVWNYQEAPCTHDGVMQNPPLMEGGFSPSTQCNITVRHGTLSGTPRRGDRCTLRVTEARSFNLQVQSVTTSPGDIFLNILCADVNQNA